MKHLVNAGATYKPRDIRPTLKKKKKSIKEKRQKMYTSFSLYEALNQSECNIQAKTVHWPNNETKEHHIQRP